ncbi:hypothetical protein FRC05_011119 [Tulasnella sp. 425]|nr:hypothetical protein FRC05_011119 [Tulasnella sp. 425]
MESGVSSGLTTTKSVKGATRYMAPELLLDGEAKHTLKSDVWAWACTTFEVLTGHEPFSNAKREEAVVTAIVMGRSPGSVDLLDSLVSDGNITYYLTFESLKSIFPDCWIGDSAKRPSSSEILNRLISPDRIEATCVQKGYGEGATLMNGHESALLCSILLPLTIIRAQKTIAAFGPWNGTALELASRLVVVTAFYEFGQPKVHSNPI